MTEVSNQTAMADNQTAPANNQASPEPTSKEMLKAFTANIYQELRDAKERGELIGWSTSNFPKEICETFGLKIMYPENHAAAVAAKKGAVDFCDKAEAMGYSADLCSYARISLGFLHREEDFGFGLDVPKPDFLCVANNICTTVIKWYENMAKELNIPFIMFDIPYNTDPDFKDHKIAYMREQLQDVIWQFEELTGKKFDYRKFHEVCAVSSENARLFQQCLDTIGATKPSPVNGFDGYNLMALMIIARCRKESTVILQKYLAELQALIESGESKFKGEEKYRILYDGITCWPYLKYTSTTLSELGVNTVASVYTDEYTAQFDDLDSLCRAYASTNNVQGIDMAIKRRNKMLGKYQCDGILCNTMRSCKPWVGLMFETERQLQKQHGLPYTLFDGDQADPRVFSKAQYETRVQGLVEVMEARK